MREIRRMGARACERIVRERKRGSRSSFNERRKVSNIRDHV